MPEYNDLRVRLHGPQMLEIKARLPMNRGSRQRLDLDLRLPAQLQLDDRSLPRSRILAALISHARYQVRREGLALLGSDDSDNPLVRLATASDTGIGSDRGFGSADVIHELRMAANLLHSALKDELRDGPADEVVRRMRPVLMELARVLKQLGVRESGSAVGEAVERVREYVWTTTPRRVARIVLEGELRETELAAMRTWLTELERTAHSFGLDPLQAGTRELERDAELKKWVQSELYLPVRESRRNDRIFQVVAAIAAGAAMTIAVLATIYAESRWSGGSLPWAIALVGAYIVKDRLKEGLRTVLVRRVPGLIQDRVVLMFEPAEQRERHGRDRATAAKIGRKVAVIRYEGTHGAWSWLHIEKRFRFRLRRMLRHQRVDAVVEILRLDVSDWLARMDREWKLWPIRDDQGRLNLSRVPRQYRFYARVGLGTVVRGNASTHRDCWFQITATREKLIAVERMPDASAGLLPEA